MIILGPLIGIGLYFGLDRTLASKRKPAIDEAEKLFKVLRLRGLNEDLLRQFCLPVQRKQLGRILRRSFRIPGQVECPKLAEK